jgi:hypothetical protein
MFGLVVLDEMEWNRVVNNWIPLFGFAKNEWNGTQWNSFHPIPSIRGARGSVWIGFEAKIHPIQK